MSLTVPFECQAVTILVDFLKKWDEPRPRANIFDGALNLSPALQILQLIFSHRDFNSRIGLGFAYELGL